jgi:hypothetical protein
MQFLPVDGGSTDPLADVYFLLSHSPECGLEDTQSNTANTCPDLQAMRAVALLWHGELPRHSWSIAAAWSGATSYRVDGELLSPSNASVVAYLSGTSVCTFSAFDSTTGTVLDLGSVFFLPLGTALAELEQVHPPDGATCLASNASFPIATDAGPGFYWVGVPGYGWEQVATSASTRSMVIPLAANGMLAVVTDPDLAGVTMTLVPAAETGSLLNEPVHSWVAEPPPEPHVFRDLPAGTYRISAKREEGCLLTSQPLQVAPGSTTEVELSRESLLEEACGSLHVTIVLPTDPSRARECQLALIVSVRAWPAVGG